jgi:hypothetical protein
MQRRSPAAGLRPARNAHSSLVPRASASAWWRAPFWCGNSGSPSSIAHLFDVQADLRKRKRQIVHSAEQPAKGDAVVSVEISPKHRMLVFMDEPAKGVADVLARHFIVLELRAHGFEGPAARLCPVDLTTLGLELPAVFSLHVEVRRRQR